MASFINGDCDHVSSDETENHSNMFLMAEDEDEDESGGEEHVNAYYGLSRRKTTNQEFTEFVTDDDED